MKFAGTAFKQKAALSFNTGMAVKFLTNNNYVLDSKDPVSGQEKKKKNSKLLSYLVWVSYKASAAPTCYLQANHSWVRKICLLQIRNGDGRSRTSPSREGQEPPHRMKLRSKSPLLPEFSPSRAGIAGGDVRKGAAQVAPH